MKLLKVNISLLLFLFLISLSLIGLKSDRPIISWGTKTLYHSLQNELAPPPEGYKPVFINYVGRHGARHLTNLTADSLLYLVLDCAGKKNSLTPNGIRLRKMDSLLLIIESGNVSNISERGRGEQEALGIRMAQHFGSVFEDEQGVIKISTTGKERTKQSARAFLKGLNLDTTHLILFNFNDNDNLAFYDISPYYKLFKESGSWKTCYALIQNSEKAKTLYNDLPTHFLKMPFLGKLYSDSIHFHSEKREIYYNSKTFTDGVYDACSIVASLDKEIINAGHRVSELDFASLISDEDIKELDYINSAEEFLIKGPGVDENGIQVKIAAPLLLSFLNSTDEYISTKKVIANLRFAHAETIAPFAALLGITGASEPISPDRMAEYNKVWKCENIIPLSSNIQWILYKNNSTGGFLIKILLNENEVKINGLKDSGTAFFYKWSDLKDFYYQKLEQMKIQKDDNMHTFLMSVQ